MSETKRTCGNCAFWCDGDYCPFTMNLHPADELGCANHKTVLEFSADYKRMVGEEVMNAEKRLKPCPFCGADEKSGVHVETIWDDKEKFCVFCEHCGVSTWEFKSIEQAVEAWNKRAVKHGAWLRRSDYLECSECGYLVDCSDGSNYCPACGARMDKKE